MAERECTCHLRNCRWPRNRRHSCSHRLGALWPPRATNKHPLLVLLVCLPDCRERDSIAQHALHPKLEINLSAFVDKTPRRAAPNALGVPWKAGQPGKGPSIAFTVTTSDSLQQIRVWISYHRAIGVTIFYIFANGQAARADNVAALRALPGVKVVLQDAALKLRHENSRQVACPPACLHRPRWAGCFSKCPLCGWLFLRRLGQLLTAAAG